MKKGIVAALFAVGGAALGAVSVGKSMKERITQIKRGRLP